MTTQEERDLRVKLRDDIQGLINDYETLTGYHISNINITSGMKCYYQGTGEEYMLLSGVEISID